MVSRLTAELTAKKGLYKIRRRYGKNGKTRRAVKHWMRHNPIWYQETIAHEWERQTGEPWLRIFEETAGKAHAKLHPTIWV